MVQSTKSVVFGLGESVDELYEFFAPMWVEVLFVLFFSLGFAVIRAKGGKGKGQKGHKPENDKNQRLYKQIQADVEAGNHQAALKTWNAAKSLGPAGVETLRNVVDVLLEVQPASMIEEVLDHFTTHRNELNNPKHINAVLDVLARSGRVALMEELLDGFRSRLGYRANGQTYEVLLGAYASVGDEKKVAEVSSVMINQARQKLSARAYSLTIKGFLKHGMVDIALRQIQDMHSKGYFVPSFAFAQLFRAAAQNNRGTEIFEAASKDTSLQIPQDAVTVLLEDCVKRDDLALALRVEKHAQESKNPLGAAAYDSLLKICVHHADVRALEIFQKMQKEDVKISEAFCVGLISRCADSKFLRFAEEIVKLVRSRETMSIGSYSAMMKVYAYCGLYDKACDLYTQIKEQGLEPDSMMYGCLMKFSVECGRTELSQELFDKCPNLEIQNYMSLIRAAGRDKDVNRAFAVLEKLKVSGVSVDVAAYNCVLDACVSAGDLERARALMLDMQKLAPLDIITYNTILKGYCSKGDIRGAKEVFKEMEAAGHAPNDISYNCLINAAVCSGIFWEAWNTIEMMERNGVKVDHYTISIMMKALKRVKDPKDVLRTLDLLDRSGVDVCSDEILLNTVLETCIRHRHPQRLERIIKDFSTCKILRPSAHTYGALIKACSSLKRLDKCHEFWNNMVDDCGMKPNEIVMGCMLDALVCNEKVEEAVELLNAWKSKLTPNTVMYSTIIKGFATSRQSARAIDMWKEMCAIGVTFNNVVYNVLIDSQARVGDMDAVSELVKSMEPNGCKPDGITYSTIVKGYCIKGDLDKAFEIFRTMQQNDMALDSIVYNTIMDGCTRHNRMDLVDLVLEDMSKYNIKPSNFTLGILVKMYGRRHQLNKAFQILEELPRKHGLQVNTQVKTCLMCACLSNNDVDRATQVYEEIRAAGGGVDAKTYSTMLAGLVRAGRLEMAVALVEDAYGLGPKGQRKLPAGQVLDQDHVEHLVRALGQNRQMESVAVPLLEKLRAAKVTLSSKLYSTALNRSAEKDSKRSAHPWH